MSTLSSQPSWTGTSAKVIGLCAAAYGKVDFIWNIVFTFKGHLQCSLDKPELKKKRAGIHSIDVDL